MSDSPDHPYKRKSYDLSSGGNSRQSLPNLLNTEKSESSSRQRRSSENADSSIEMQRMGSPTSSSSKASVDSNEGLLEKGSNQTKDVKKKLTFAGKGPKKDKKHKQKSSYSRHLPPEIKISEDD